MANHPNRGGGKGARCKSPKPDEIKDMRQFAILTQKEAADLICASERTWQQWESGDRRMHPAFWKLFLILALVGQDPLDRAMARKAQF
jgi:DNA-binding transcriptional regulator YiaG